MNSLFAQTLLWLGVWPFLTNERRVAKSDLFLWGQWRIVCLRKDRFEKCRWNYLLGPRDIRPRQPRSNSEINKNHGSGIYVYWHHAMAIVSITYYIICKSIDKWHLHMPCVKASFFINSCVRYVFVFKIKLSRRWTRLNNVRRHQTEKTSARVSKWVWEKGWVRSSLWLLGLQPQRL